MINLMFVIWLSLACLLFSFLEGASCQLLRMVADVNNTLRVNSDVAFSGDVFASNGAVSVNTMSTTVNYLSSTIFNVRAYGAKGDGVTDDTTAFTNAITAMGTAPSTLAAKKATLFIPAGRYIISNTLTFTGPAYTLCIRGDTKASEIIWAFDGNLFMIGNAYTTYFSMFDFSIVSMITNKTATSTAFVIQGASMCDIARIYIYQDPATWGISAAYAVGSGIRFTGEIFKSIHIDNVEMTGLLGNGIEFTSLTRAWIQKSYFGGAYNGFVERLGSSMGIVLGGPRSR
eukprot:TRINITY_DN11365_c0_g1_i4.p1 TRINITY_DN11365_c0_g1~~TRINITY_DN11365_c0_g1_i4.p1  ORF type:complete len:287 (+),score=40.39 TRINITY_DN11365_c0_g1_i4:3-863(+)